MVKNIKTFDMRKTTEEQLDAYMLDLISQGYWVTTTLGMKDYQVDVWFAHRTNLVQVHRTVKYEAIRR